MASVARQRHYKAEEACQTWQRSVASQEAMQGKCGKAEEHDDEQETEGGTTTQKQGQPDLHNIYSV